MPFPSPQGGREICYLRSFCRTLPISAQGSFRRIFFRSSTVNWLPAVVRGSASHDTGTETGARGPGKTIYFFDPSRHLLEIRCYADMSARDPS